MYKLIQNSSSILRMADNSIIPNSIDNADFKVYSDWLASGNTPFDADSQPVVELVCTPWQIRKALNQLGLRDAVEGLIKTSVDREVTDGWEFATSWKEFDPLIRKMAVPLKLTSNDIHNIFNLAKDL